jgi:hypothetical protein
MALFAPRLNFKPRPASSVTNSLNRAVRHAGLTGHFDHRHSALEQFFNLDHSLRRMPLPIVGHRLGVLFTSGSASRDKHVASVFFWSPFIKMIRVNTRRIVTCVQSPFSKGDVSSKSENKRKPMRGHILPVDTNGPVSMLVAISRPQNALTHVHLPHASGRA